MSTDFRYLLDNANINHLNNSNILSVANNQTFAIIVIIKQKQCKCNDNVLF